MTVLLHNHRVLPGDVNAVLIESSCVSVHLFRFLVLPLMATALQCFSGLACGYEIAYAIYRV